MAASDLPDSPSGSDSRKNTSTRSSDPENAQLYPLKGVSTNVSSVAIDRGLLNFAGATPSAPATMANSPVSSAEAVSDVDAMLLVKPGDESAFAYLVRKYRRPMVGFISPLSPNPSTPAQLAQTISLPV